MNTPKKKMGRPPEDGIGRVKLGGSAPFVSLETFLVLQKWKELYGIVPGRSIDALVAFAKDNPAFRMKSPKKVLQSQNTYP